MSLRLVFAGTPAVAVPTLEALLASEHEVVGVLTKPDAPTGRGRRIQASPVSQVATRAGIPMITPSSLADEAAHRQLLEWVPDAVVVVAYGLLVPRALLDIPRHGWINAHFSSLPRWRGAAPVQHAIASGDATIAVTTFRIEEGLDTGPFLMRSEPIAIDAHEDSGHLLARLATVAAGVMIDTLEGVAAGTLEAVPQEATGVTFAPRISVADARIDWTEHFEVVDRWIRACTPAPGAWTTVGESRLRIGAPRDLVADDAAIPGEITAEKSRVLVGARGGRLILGSVHPMAGKEMSAADWARGFRGAAPRRFDT